MNLHLDLPDGTFLTAMEATQAPRVGETIILRGKQDDQPAIRFHTVLTVAHSYDSEGYQGRWKEGGIYLIVTPAHPSPFRA
jgi:hypothetical protein